MDSSYRSILEVAKWMSPQHTLQSGSLVSTQWCRACNSQELWNHYLDQAHFSKRIHRPAKEEYRVGCSTIPLVSPSVLYLFDHWECTWREVSLDRKLDTIRTASWTFVPPGRFLCSGGCESFAEEDEPAPGLTSAYMISQLGTVSELPPMRIPRKRHGTIALGECCYVFGGSDGYSGMVTTEKISLKDGQWVQMADMACPRLGFNPCVYQHQVILVGGMTLFSEAFDPVTETFSDFHLNLKSSNTCSLLLRDRLVVLTPTKVYRGGQWQDKPWSVAFGNMNPKGVGSVCYLPEALVEFHVVAVDVDTGDVVRYTPRLVKSH